MEELKPNTTTTTPTTSQPPNNDLPKTKDDWQKLAKEDPQRWQDLTQQRMDTVIRESREAKEKLSAAEQREKNLQAEVERFRQPPPVIEPQSGEPIQYGRGNYPQTEDDWTLLFLERPAFATDLRNAYNQDLQIYNQNVQTQKKHYYEERTKSANTLLQEHSDMYVPELEADGTIKKDSQGKPVLKIDPASNWPIFNPNSEKGKLWTEIWEEEEQSAKRADRPNVFAASGKGPLLMMAEMERQLRMKGATKMNEQNNFSQDGLDGVAPRGVTPPAQTTVKFASEGERAEAERAVSRGTYKSLEEWYQWRNTENRGYAETNSRPDFTKKVN